MRELRTCDVHRILDNDLTPRDCIWCQWCKAWICVDDKNDFVRRAAAGFARAVGGDSEHQKAERSDSKNLNCGDCRKPKQ